MAISSLKKGTGTRYDPEERELKIVFLLLIEAVYLIGLATWRLLTFLIPIKYLKYAAYAALFLFGTGVLLSAVLFCKVEFRSVSEVKLILTEWHLVEQSYASTSSGEGTIDEIIEAAAAEHDVDPLLVMAIIKQESAYKVNAVSHKGAVGLMQLMPATAMSACGLGPGELTDPYKNIQCGTRYFSQQLETFDDNIKFALAAYNAGPSATRKAVSNTGDIPDYPETRDYVKKVLMNYGELVATQRVSRNS